MCILLLETYKTVWACDLEKISSPDSYELTLAVFKFITTHHVIHFAVVVEELAFLHVRFTIHYSPHIA